MRETSLKRIELRSENKTTKITIGAIEKTKRFGEA